MAQLQRKAIKVILAQLVLKAIKVILAQLVLKVTKVTLVLKVMQVLQARKAIQLGILSLLVRKLMVMVPRKTLNKILRTPTPLKCLQAKI